MTRHIESTLAATVLASYLATFGAMVAWEPRLALICCTVWVTASVAFAVVVLRGAPARD